LLNALNVEAEGEQLVEDLNERVDIIRHKLKFMENKPTVACIEWLEPMMVSGNWIPELVSIAGGTPILAQAGKHSPYVSWESIRESDPEIILLMPCGFSIERTMREINVSVRATRLRRTEGCERTTASTLPMVTSTLTAPAHG
jgi:iron complex transport system substrate-binding protein